MSKFLHSTGDGNDVTDGSTDILAATLAAVNLKTSLPVKTDAGKVLYSTLLDIADVDGLATSLSGALLIDGSNSMAADLQLGGFKLSGNPSTGGNLILQSTSNAVKGHIICEDKITAPDGTSSLPSYTFTSDLTAGMSTDLGDTVLSAAGVESLRCVGTDVKLAGTLNMNGNSIDEVKGLDYTGVMLIGASSATSVDIGGGGIKTNIRGNIDVSGTLNMVSNDITNAGDIYCGQLIASSGVTTTGNIDQTGAVALQIGPTTASSVDIGAVAIPINLKGRLNTLLDGAGGISLNGTATSTALYHANIGSTNSFSGGQTTDGIDDSLTGHSVRMRINTGSTQGLIIENNSEVALMQVRGNTGNVNILGTLALGNNASGDGVLDTTSAGALKIGPTTTSGIELGSASIDTDVKGDLAVVGSISSDTVQVGGIDVSATKTASVVIDNESATNCHMIMNGVAANSNDSTEGLCFTMTANATNNRGLMVHDSAHAINATNAALRLVCQGTKFSMGALSTNRSVALPLYIDSPSIRPVLTTYDLGSSTEDWRDLFLSRNIIMGGTVDTITATALALGPTTASSVELGSAAIDTDVKGDLIVGGDLQHETAMIEQYRDITIAAPTTITSATPDTAIAVNLDTDMITTHSQDMSASTAGVITFSGSSVSLIETTYNLTFHNDKKSMVHFYAVSSNTTRYPGTQVISGGPTLPAGAIPASVVSEDYDVNSAGDDIVISMHFFWHADVSDTITLYCSSDTASTTITTEKLSTHNISMLNTP